MDSELLLSEVDVDGAIRESAEAAESQLALDGDTRGDFLRKAGLAGGAAMGGGALLSALVPATALAKGKGRPPAAFGKGDIGILNYALTLEYLEAAFYNEAKRKGVGRGLTHQGRVFLNAVHHDEQAHVKFLKAALGGKRIKRPKFDFGGATSDPATFLATAYALENTGVGAYSGQATNIKNPAYVKAAVSILTIEARHASVVGLLLKDSRAGISPNGAFDKPLKASMVLRRVKKTHFIK